LEDSHRVSWETRLLITKPTCCNLIVIRLITYWTGILAGAQTKPSLQLRTGTVQF
jgi:hypothetical protein